ncbi:MAG: cupin domain-containing protein [Agathobaculum sp.]|jgi:ethanolamine utilization protein EutQ|uniref:cupin domain-containing protein n=1 Tax=Agathobaculum sp. TaxID=2048138 RepID=UPI003D8FF78F
MQVNEELIRSLVEKVLAEAGAQKPAEGKKKDCGFEKTVDQSGVLGVKVSTVQLEPFEGREDVRLKDVATLEEAPRIGCGIMELRDGADFEWTLTYDEWDVVLEGRLEIRIDGRTVGGDAGDVLYIPRGSHIHFTTPQYAKFAYTVFPADW